MTGAAQLWLRVCGSALVALSMTYTILACFALRARRVSAQRESAVVPPATILKPLRGEEYELYERLRTFCEQRRADVQIVFGVRDPGDPALVAVRRLQREFPQLDLQVVVNPAQHGTSGKVSNLVNMLPFVRHEYLVIADSDVRVSPDYLERVVSPLLDEGVGIVTCLYRGWPRPGLWSLLGSLFINEWFRPSVCFAALFGS
ncbi:MAG TPA: glycosyltransferase, partial [Steroidobacteraceae bacterium]|nr:glycosyltransferase [Steroidobacteraceae bacterium]